MRYQEEHESAYARKHRGNEPPGIITMDGADWQPCQPRTYSTPPFPEYISGHCTSAFGVDEHHATGGEMDGCRLEDKNGHPQLSTLMVLQEQTPSGASFLTTARRKL
jgi:hypothetical protein